MPRAVDLESGYENIAATCPHCNARTVFNRASDLGHFEPIANQTVACGNGACSAEFDICGDLINPSHETLLLDCYEFVKEKRYMQAVLSAATAYESFFAHFLRVQLLYRPSRRDHVTQRDDLRWLNDTATLLQERTGRLAFEAMRRVFLRAAVDDVRPTTVTDAESYVQAISGRPPEVPRTDVEAVADDSRRELLLCVHDSTISKLRNNVVHKNAYRPRLDETRAAIDDAYKAVFGLGQHYKLGNDDYHLNASSHDD